MRRYGYALHIVLIFVLAPTLPGADASITVNATCSFQHALTAANTDRAGGGCIAGSGADAITRSEDHDLAAALPNITSDITINGNGYSLRGDDGFAILTISSSGSLTLNRVAIMGGNGSGVGGIMKNGALTIKNSTIAKNSGGEVGGIYNVGSLELIHSTVSENTGGFVGGVLFSGGSNMELYDSLLAGNTNGDCFGGVNASAGKLVGSGSCGSAITANPLLRALTGSPRRFPLQSGSPAIDAGAIKNAVGTLTVSSSRFNNNSAHDHSCAILKGRTLTVTNSVFSGNLVNAGYAGSSGGAISTDPSATTTIRRSAFRGNSANRGGAIRNFSSLDVSNSAFYSNTATRYGGAISSWSTATITHSTIAGNSAGTNMGGSLHNDAGTIKLRNSIVSGNTGDDCVAGLSQNVNNRIQDGRCSPALRGDPKLSTLTGSSAATDATNTPTPATATRTQTPAMPVDPTASSGPPTPIPAPTEFCVNVSSGTYWLFPADCSKGVCAGGIAIASFACHRARSASAQTEVKRFHEMTVMPFMQVEQTPAKDSLDRRKYRRRLPDQPRVYDHRLGGRHCVQSDAASSLQRRTQWRLD